MNFPLLVLIFALAVGVAQAGPLGGAGDPFNFVFDEWGYGRYQLLDYYGQPIGPWVYSPGQVVGGFLTFILPEPVVMGDVRIWEDSDHSVLSDVLRFTNAAGDLIGFGGDRLIFMSDPGGGHPADVAAWPELTPADSGGVLEVNGVLDWYPGGNEYHAYSDYNAPPVPEPGSLLLLGTGFVGVAGFLRRKLAA